MELPKHRHLELQRRVEQLEKATADLEAGMSSRVGRLEYRLREQRSMNLRVADLADLVIELMPAAGRAARAQAAAADPRQQGT